MKESAASGADGDAALLARVPFFAGLTAEQLIELQGSSLRLKDAETVFVEGDDGHGMYVVLSGAVRIFRKTADGEEFPLAVVGPGEFFGEMALLDGGRRSASAAATAPTQLVFVGRDDLERLLAGTDGRVALDVLSAMSRLVRERGDKVWQQELARREVETQTELERHRALSQLVAGVAHELGTPLGIANTAAGMIVNRLGAGAPALNVAEGQQNAAIADVLEAAELVRSSLERANRLVQNFKKVSVQQAADPLETVDVVATVQDVVDLYSIEGRRHGMIVTVTAELDEGARQWTGHPGRLGQVLLNLLTNAERYAYPSGGGQVDVTIAARTDGKDGPTVTIRDYGTGIPEADRARIFEPFFTTGRSRGGTGLGLAIVHNLVTAGMGGSIEVESEVGAGTTVTITLPNLEGDAAS